MLKYFSVLLLFLFAACYQAEKSFLHLAPILQGNSSSTEAYFYYSPTSYSLMVGQYIEIKPTKQGNIVACTSSPPLPAGLNLSAQCDITGTPQFNTPFQTYTISAKFDNSQERIANLYIGVYSGGPPPGPGMPAVYFLMLASSINEATPTASIQVVLYHASTSTITVNYAVVPGGTATVGVDYTLASGTLTFNPGDLTKNITVSIIDDSLAEPNETIIITLSSPTNATLGVNSSHTLTIMDNDPPTISYAETKLVLVKGQFYNQEATVTGNLSSCMVSPGLPAGLSLSAADCKISGVPSMTHATLSSPSTYTITAYNGSYYSSQSIELVILDDTHHLISGIKYYLSTQGQSCTQCCASLGGVGSDIANTSKFDAVCNTALSTGFGITTSTSYLWSGEYPCMYHRSWSSPRRIYSTAGFSGGALTYSHISYNLVCPCSL